MRRNRTVVASLVAGLAILVGACSSGVGTPGGGTNGGAKTLNGAGATFPAPLYQQWADVYNRKAGVQVNYQAIGSGGGVQQITSKTVDFGASDAPMKDEELSKAPGVIHIPMVFGAVVVTYNLAEVKTSLNLTAATIAGMFMGKIKKWNDSAIAADNPGTSLPNKSVTVVHRSDGSGTTNLFTSFLADANSEWRSKVGAGKEVEWPLGIGQKGNDGVTSLVKQTPGATGYVELAFAKQNDLPYAKIKNRAGTFIEATLASTSAAAATATVPGDLRFSVINASGADAYPIAGATWLLVYQNQSDGNKAKSLVAFLWWAIHDGQSYAEPLLFAKLPATLVQKSEDQVKSITFNGKAVFTG